MSSPLLLAEELFLLAHDDESGKSDNTHKKVWGLFPTTSWPEVNPEPERTLRERLTAVLVDGAHPDVRTALLKPLGLVRGVVGKQHKKQAEARAKEIADAGAVGSAVSAAVSQSVQAVQLAW